MIITGLHNLIKQNINKTVTNPKALPLSFTSGISLNRDVFVSHDEKNAAGQYLNIYEPGKNKSVGVISFDDYEKAIKELNSDKTPDSDWVNNNSKLLKKLFGFDLSKSGDASELFLQELNTNREKFCENILKTFQKDLRNYYRYDFTPINGGGRDRVADFDSNAIKKYNFEMSKLKSNGYITSGALPFYYRTTEPLNIQKLKKDTNANIIDVRNRFNEISILENAYRIIDEVKEHYNKTGQKSIILMKDLYKISRKSEGDYYLSMIAREFLHNYNAIIITEDIPPVIRSKTSNNNLKFSDIPAYQEDKQRFIKEIIAPVKNNDIDAPKIIIFNSKTTPKDTREFLTAGLNEIKSDINYISPTTNVNDFGGIITGIKNKAQKKTDGSTIFVIIPQAYKYIAGRPENVELIKSLQSFDGNKIIPVLYSSYPEKLLEKVQLENNYKQFTLNSLNDAGVEDILRFYTDKADDYVNDLITSGKHIEPINIEFDYKNLAGMLKHTSYCGFKDIKGIADKALNSYIQSQKHTFEEYLLENIAGGTIYEN